MNKEQKVTSLPLSKKIYALAKKKGIELESEYSWENIGTMFISTGFDESQWVLTKTKIVIDSNEHYPAYDTSELGEVLPGNINGNVFQIQKGMLGNIYYCVWIRIDSKMISKTIHQEQEKNMAEAMGKMYYFLLDNNLL